MLPLVLCCALGATPPLPARLQQGEVVPWENAIRTVAGDYWVERAAQAQAESGWNQFAVSPVGAMGPVQVMPSTLKWWKDMHWVPKEATGFDIPACFAGQNGHMLWLRRYWLDLDHRLAAYNAGQGSILKADRYADEIGYEEEDAWLSKALVRVTGVANAKQTQDYIKHNEANRKSILKLLGGKP